MGGALISYVGLVGLPLENSLNSSQAGTMFILEHGVLRVSCVPRLFNHKISMCNVIHTHDIIASTHTSLTQTADRNK